MLILFLGFTVYPLVASVQYTFYDWDGIGAPNDFVGLENYVDIVRDPFFWNAFRNTFFYTIVVVPVQLLIALGLAVILDAKWLRARSIFRFVFLSPIVTSSAIVGILFTMILATVGRDVNDLLIALGVLNGPIDWLGNPNTAIWLIVVVGIWIELGYPIVYFLAALQSIDPVLYDAARVDGADSLACFRHITVPLIRPVGFVVLLVTTLHSLRVFDIVQVMTRGAPYYATDVVGTYIYRQAFFVTPTGDSGARLGYASAAAFFMGLLVMGISLVQFFVTRRAIRQREEIRHAKNRA
jgi:ABC-type sugar transport system permease subunit